MMVGDEMQMTDDEIDDRANPYPGPVGLEYQPPWNPTRAIVSAVLISLGLFACLWAGISGLIDWLWPLG